MRENTFRLSILCVALVAGGCGSDGGNTPGASGGQAAPSGGTSGSGGAASTGGSSTTGGVVGSGGSRGSSTTGGAQPNGGASGSAGASVTGGVKATGGTSGGAGGAQVGGTTAAGGQAGGAPSSGGRTGTGGAGGSSSTAAGGSGGSSSTGTGPSSVDCNATLPTGGTERCGQNTQGSAGGQSWSLWSNAISPSGCITTFSTPAFSARWSNNSDFLARVGLEFGNAGKTYDQYGTLKADFSYKKSGTAGGYSYIGIYGWTNNPCVEWYIVDDRWGTMPFNAYNATLKGTVQIDGTDYKLFSNKTTGTGGSRCSGVSQWDQFWSIRQSARQCGTITISDHFKAWEAAGMKMGVLLEAKILVETGGGTGNIEFPVAKVTAQ